MGFNEIFLSKKNAAPFLTKLITVFFYISVFFPFIQILPGDSDTQPQALILAILISLMGLLVLNQIPKIFIYLAVLFGVAILISIFSDFNSFVIRRIANYASLLFIPLATFYVLKINHGFNRLFLKITIFIWFLTGFIQTYFKPNFLNFILSNTRTQFDRGVYSLAAEPTFYAIVCLFLFYLVMLLFNVRDKKVYGFLLLIQIVFLAKSSLVVLFLFFMLFVYSLLNIKKVIAHLNQPYMLIFAPILLIAVFSFQLFDWTRFDEIRLFQMLNLFLDNPVDLILKDKSGNARFGHIFFTILGFLKNYGVPNGFNEWKPFLIDNLPSYRSVFWYVSPLDYAMSGYGAAIFELGIIGLMIPVTVTLCFYHFFYRKNKRTFWFYLIIINVLMLNAIPLSFPIFNFFIGCLIYYSKLRKDVINLDKLVKIKIYKNRPYKG